MTFAEKLARVVELADELQLAVADLTAAQEPGGPAQTPGAALGIGSRNHFQIDVGRSGDTAITTKTEAQLAAGWQQEPYFYTDPLQPGWALFGVRVDGPTTPNTKYPRAELRELERDGRTKMAFNPLIGDNWLSATSRPLHLPLVKPSVVFGQLHDNADDVIELAVQPTSSYLTSGKLEVVCRINGTSTGIPKLVADYHIGDPLTWMMRVGSFGWEIYLGELGTPRLTSKQAGRPKLATLGKNAYFKAGCYLQTNTAIEGNATDYGLVAVANLKHWHTGWPTPAVA